MTIKEEKEKLEEIVEFKTNFENVFQNESKSMVYTGKIENLKFDGLDRMKCDAKITKIATSNQSYQWTIESKNVLIIKEGEIADISQFLSYRQGLKINGLAQGVKISNRLLNELFSKIDEDIFFQYTQSI
ncbi:MAG: hypothetical protein ABIH25_00970 [Candidatus Woesearchaeota archaeon]